LNDSTNPYESTSPVDSSSDSPAAIVHPLTNPSFVGFITTQFLGAFNDNLFKQLLLLLAIPVVAAGAVPEGPDLQGIATVVFGLPFVLFGGIAGYLADRFSKRRVIVLSKFGEIVVMAIGLLAFLAAPVIGFWGLWVVLFLMGMQSAFFGPGKYGILPEMLKPNQLARANGIVLMTTFIAIIFGTSAAGWLKDALVSPDLPRFTAARELWLGSLVCIGIAVLGTAASFLVHKVKPAAPGLPFKYSYLGVPKVMISLLRGDRPLLLALGASCVFWLIAGLTVQAVNSLCTVQLGLSATLTSLMVALISVGIAVGGALAGWMSRGGDGHRVIVIGMWGVVVTCALLAITIPGRGHLLGFYGSIPALILLGGAAAFFAIPIQVFLQARPPEDLKGRMIAVMNQANFFAIVVSGVTYMVLDALITAMNWPRSALFAAMALLFLPVAIGYRMESEPESAEATLNASTS
jgi:MFS family permease